MNKLLEQISEMHKKFGLESSQVPFTPAEFEFRCAAMLEELDEYVLAMKDIDFPEAFDALIDLTVFVLGTVDRMGFSPIFDEGFKRVMTANLSKEVGQTPDTKERSFHVDLIKPADWIAPNHEDLIKSL